MQNNLSIYQNNVMNEVIKTLSFEEESVDKVLDFGSGDGWYAHEFITKGIFKNITCVEIQERKNSLIKPIIYDGEMLPFNDLSFDLTYCFDTLHHCPDPTLSLKEVLRCSKKYFLIKDHTYKNSLEYAALSLLDLYGNCPNDIACNFKYQKGFSWFEVLRQSGFSEVITIYPANIHNGRFKKFINSLNFISLWKR